MKVTDLAELSKVDTEITKLHSQLSELYVLRSDLISSTPPAKITKHEASSSSVEITYQQLQQIWQNYNIAIPTFKTLKKKLISAEQLITSWETYDAIFKNSLSIVLVPPTSYYGIPVKTQLRQQQRLLHAGDIIESDVTLPQSNKQWRVLVVYSAQSGISFESLPHILGNTQYKLLGQDIRSLGIAEYSALTLQLSQPIDTRTWTSLLKNYPKENEVAPAAQCLRKYYRFVLNDIWGALPDDRIRPAIEIT